MEIAGNMENRQKRDSYIYLKCFRFYMLKDLYFYAASFKINAPLPEFSGRCPFSAATAVYLGQQYTLSLMAEK